MTITNSRGYSIPAAGGTYRVTILSEFPRASQQGVDRRRAGELQYSLNGSRCLRRFPVRKNGSKRRDIARQMARTFKAITRAKGGAR